ncbi:two-component sensor histidine kinase, partial [Mycobacterium sp. ITM-2017-0098]
DLLEISRHDAGFLGEVPDVVERALHDGPQIHRLDSQLGDAGVEMDVDLPADEIIAEVDPRRVERILRNLIANAIDHAERKP